MKDQIVLITGANSGMGKVTALELARKGARVVMICRDKTKGEQAREEIIRESGNKSVELLIADLALQKSVRELAAEIHRKYDHIDVLVNNAGLALSGYSETSEGIETTFATNVLSMFLLTELVKDLLAAAPAARVVNVASSTHTGATLNIEDIGFKKNYSLFKTYNQSKLCNIILTYEFARRFKEAGTKVSVNCMNPGPVKTGLARDMSPVFKLMGKLFFLTPEKASETIIYLASSKEVEGVSGKYFAKNKALASSALSNDPEAAKKLWALCVNMTKKSEVLEKA